MTFEFSPVGFAETPYREKFSIPRQPGLVTADHSRIRLQGDSNREEILRGLDGFSHIWLVFVFHEAMREHWKPMVRPPRLGGNRKVGVFASRSPFRPNPIGLSAVKIQDIQRTAKHWYIEVEGCDLLNETPILDIKPYLPYSDAHPQANGGFADSVPQGDCSVLFADSARHVLHQQQELWPHLETLVRQILGQQPQPAYHETSNDKNDGQARIYGITLYNFNIRWRFTTNNHNESAIEVLTIDGEEA